MKKMLIVTFSIFLCGSLFSQKIDDRLLKSFDESLLIDLKKTNTEKYNLLISSIGKALEIVEYPKGKMKAKELSSISLPKGEYTYLDLGLEIRDVNQYFRIVNSDKILVVKSFFVLENEHNK